MYFENVPVLVTLAESLKKLFFPLIMGLEQNPRYQHVRNHVPFDKKEKNDENFFSGSIEGRQTPCASKSMKSLNFT